MNIYAIHRENVWTTDYNVMVFSSKRLAESIIKVANEKYDKWSEKNKYLRENGNHISFLYENRQPPKYRIEVIKVRKE